MSRPATRQSSTRRVSVGSSVASSSNQAPRQGSSAASQSPRMLSNRPRCANKTYRCPASPPPQQLSAHEQGFTLDCVAVGSISADYFRTNPKLGPALPPYNSKLDNHANAYFRFIGVDRTLNNTKQVPLIETVILFIHWIISKPFPAPSQQAFFSEFVKRPLL